MVSSCRIGDQNQGRYTRRYASTDKIAYVLTHDRILFHPDCDRRLWHRTRSAVLRVDYGALAGSPIGSGYRRWGLSPRPENRFIASIAEGIAFDNQRLPFSSCSATTVHGRCSPKPCGRGEMRHRCTPDLHMTKVEIPGIIVRIQRNHARICLWIHASTSASLPSIFSVEVN